MARRLQLAVALALLAVAAAACGLVTSDDPAAATGSPGNSGAGSGGAGGSAAASAGQPGSGGSAVAGEGGSGGVHAGGAAGSGGVEPTGPCLSYEASEPVVFDQEIGSGVVAWTGDGYVSVWAANHEIGSVPREWFDIELVHFDRAGSVTARETPYSTYELDEYGVVRDVGRAVVLAAAPTDDGVGVLWCHYDSDSWDGQLMFGRLDVSGTAAIEPQPLAPCNWQLPARLAWNGSGFGAVWESGGALSFAELDESGALTSEILEIPVDGMIAWLFLFWDGETYALAWHEFHAALGANRFVVISREGAPLGESVLLSDPDTYAGSLFVNQVAEGYTAVWSQAGITDPWEGSLLMADLDRVGHVVGELRQLEEAPIAALQYSGYEYGAILGHYTTIDSYVTYSYGFTTLSQNGEWQTEELPLLPAERFAQPISFDWHQTGFGMFFTQREGEERRLAYLEIRCQR